MCCISVKPSKKSLIWIEMALNSIFAGLVGEPIDRLENVDCLSLFRGQRSTGGHFAVACGSKLFKPH